METMTRKEEQELLQAVKEAALYASKGVQPAQAIAKVAQDMSLPKEHVKRVTEAFNVSATLSHFKHASGDSKAADFPTASIDDVFGILYPGKVDAPVKIAADTWIPDETEYVETQDFLTDDIPAFHTDKVSNTGYSTADAINSITEDYRKEASVLEYNKSLLNQIGEKLNQQIDKLASYFVAHGSASTEELPDDVLPMIVERVPHLRKLGQASTGNWRVELDKAELIRDQYLKQASICQSLTDKLDDLSKLTDNRINLVKKSNLTSAVTGGLAGAALQDIIDPNTQGARDALRGELQAPEVVAERKAIRAQALLKSVVSSDEVLRRAPQNDVIRAYNDIASVAPGVVEQPMLARSWLRRVVESRGLDPFDIHELVKTERTLRGLDSGEIEKDTVTRG